LSHPSRRTAALLALGAPYGGTSVIAIAKVARRAIPRRCGRTLTPNFSSPPVSDDDRAWCALARGRGKAVHSRCQGKGRRISSSRACTQAPAIRRAGRPHNPRHPTSPWTQSTAPVGSARDPATAPPAP
jgi:hypothetical protein